ncbi:MAG: ABC transporter permease [Methanomassiliicoccus sp.]|nr:ABC transporter permease [Methanomassiliicoccus sp.]
MIIPVLIGVSLIIFTLTRMTGDPAAAYINEKMSASQIADVYDKYHFNEPAYVQYLYWFNGILNMDWGWSKTATMPVTDAIAYYLPATFELALTSIIIAIIIGIFLGTVSAVKKNKPFDHSTRLVSLLGVSIPVFWLGLMLLVIFYNTLHLAPDGGRTSMSFVLSRVVPNQMATGFYTLDSLAIGNLDLFADVLWHLILPAVTLSFASIALILRMQRNSMLEVLQLDYIKTARAKGLPEKVVIKKHARKNALIPTTTVVGLAFGALLSGAVLTESIFSWPGLGRWSANSIKRMDTASILGFCLLIAFIYVIANLIVDIMYAYLDPRVKLG